MTSIIRANTDQLRSVARQMRGAADQILADTGASAREMEVLAETWSGSARDRGMARWAEIHPRYQPAAEQLNHFASELDGLAARLEEAARVFGDGGMGFVAQSVAGINIGKGEIFENHSEGDTPWYMNPEKWDFFKDKAEKSKDLYEAIKNSYLAATNLSFRPGDRYPNQFFVKGGDKELREALGLPTHLAQIKVNPGLGNLFSGQNWSLGKRIANAQIGETLQSNSFKIGVVADVALNGWKNWDTYKGQENATAKIVTGTLVDTALTVGFGLGGQWLGTTAGVAIGAAIGGPFGAVIGAQVGGFLGNVAGSYLGSWISEQPGVKDAIGSAVDTSAKFVKDAAEATTHIASDVVDAVQNQARKVDEGIRAVGDTINNFFKPRLGLFGR